MRNRRLHHGCALFAVCSFPTKSSLSLAFSPSEWNVREESNFSAATITAADDFFHAIATTHFLSGQAQLDQQQAQQSVWNKYRNLEAHHHAHQHHHLDHHHDHQDEQQQSLVERRPNSHVHHSVVDTSSGGSGGLDNSFCRQTDHHHPSPTMFMDGFHWSLISSSSRDCLSYLGLWQVTSRLSLVIAMVISFGFAICLEYNIMIAKLLLLRRRQQRQRRRSIQTPPRQEIFRSYATSSLLGYLNMLIVMSYSIELLLSVVAGHMAGQYYFGRLSSSASSFSSFSSSFSPLHADSVALDKEKIAATEEGNSGSSKLQSLIVCCLRLQRSWRDVLLFSIPITRERLRRQQQFTRPQPNGQQMQKPIVISSFVAADDDESETPEGEESIHDDDDIPLLRKRDMKG